MVSPLRELLLFPNEFFQQKNGFSMGGASLTQNILIPWKCIQKQS